MKPTGGQMRPIKPSHAPFTLILARQQWSLKLNQ